MSYEFFNTRLVTPRKSHQCEQCRCAIAMGERCHYSSGKFDGEFYAYYEHADCRAAWLEVQKEALHDDGYATFLADDCDLNESRSFIMAAFPTVAVRLWPALVAA